MIHLTRFLKSFLLICGISVGGLAAGASYEAPMPVELATDPDLCAYLPCKDVMPGADSFSPRMGKPAYVEAYQNRKERHAGRDDHGDKNEKHGGKDDHG